MHDPGDADLVQFGAIREMTHDRVIDMEPAESKYDEYVLTER